MNFGYPVYTFEDTTVTALIILGGDKYADKKNARPGRDKMERVKAAEDFEWDVRKDRQNARRHHIDFQTARRIWAGPVLDGPDDREDYGKERFIAIGAIDNRVVVVVYTWRGDKRRIVSARKATSHERETYYSALADQESGGAE